MTDKYFEAAITFMYQVNSYYYKGRFSESRDMIKSSINVFYENYARKKQGE